MHHRSLSSLLEPSAPHRLLTTTEVASLSIQGLLSTHVLLLVSVARPHTTLSHTTTYTALRGLLWQWLSVPSGIVTSVTRLDWSLWVGVIWTLLGVLP